MVETTPLVSCIMPTYNRREFIPHAIRYFLRQEYENKELIIIDDGTDSIRDLVPELPSIHFYRLPRKITLGAKLNLACRYAKGTIIANWDDDDWYAPWRLRYQVDSILNSGKQLCGINKLLYYDLRSKDVYQYVYPSNQRVWLLGSSLCYTKALWSKNAFADIDVGMDGLFVWNTAPDLVLPLSNHQFAVHMIHKDNISPKNTSGSWWHTHPAREVESLMGDDWQYYINGSIRYPAKTGYPIPVVAGINKTAILKNVYACLVHEREDCITDLVQNLHYQDPGSTILLYNGSSNSGLIPRHFPWQRFNAVIHPAPSRVQHGYLHKFALNSLQFALDNLGAGSITMVDSDQLCIRPGYTAYMEQFLATVPHVGMLSSNAQRVDRNNKNNHIAQQAFREYELWKPLLQQFREGEEHFVHWTFWPSSVFTAAAARDLLKLCRENTVLQAILLKSRIWATEEVILPTLVRLLGYEIGTNPCSYDLVRYRQPVRFEELNTALKDPAAFWVHPVERVFMDPVRKYIRGHFNEYDEEKNLPFDNRIPEMGYPVAPLLKKIKNIQGWLSDAEAGLLVGCTARALGALPGPHHIVEVGSYHGKSTVLFGTVIKDLFPAATLSAVDPHDGKQGAVDQGVRKFPPSIDYLKKNIAAAGLSGNVKIIQSRAAAVQWDQPVSFLFIDGLHDYRNVSEDCNHFAGWVQAGGYIAFHDYADYFPGVKKFVKELLDTGKYSKAGKTDSLVVLQKK